MILTLRTDTPTAEIGLFNADGSEVAYFTWLAERRLAKEVLQAIKDQLDKNDVEFTSIKGVVAFTGPGSFTGLRIGITVANTLAYSCEVPIVGFGGEHWVADGISALAQGKNHRIVVPHYGAEARITQPRK